MTNQPSRAFIDASPSRIRIGSIVCIIALCTFPMTSQAIEEPSYQVIRQLDEVELREYAPYVVAEVTVPGPTEEAGSQAFPILAGYIFGKNKDGRKYAMTAPVTQAAASVNLKMTAPVAQTPVPGGFRVQFVLPKGVTLASAPIPLDTRVTLREVPSSQVAVIRYSGFWSAANYEKHLATLQTRLKDAAIAWDGEPVYARYNAPFTPWFMRRNEIWLPLASGK